ncbi:hypothetical protein ACOSP7_029608 [Xanthoceras sorbifolium]
MGLWPPQAMEDPEEGWAPSHNTAKWSGYYPDRICQDPLFVPKFDRVDYGSNCGYNAPGSKLGFLKRKKKKNHSLSLFVLCLLILSPLTRTHTTGTTNRLRLPPRNLASRRTSSRLRRRLYPPGRGQIRCRFVGPETETSPASSGYWSITQYRGLVTTRCKKEG